jgi:hypothetical protein
MARFIRTLLAALVGVVITAPAASAAPDSKLEALLGDLFEKVLEIPKPENPLAGNGNPCVVLGNKVVAPFQGATDDLTCTVKFGTKIFVAAFVVECSTVESAPFFGRTERELRQCVRALDPRKVTLTVDRKRVPLTVVETRLLRLDLPANDIFGVDARRADSVGRGSVALLRQLPPGTHKIFIEVKGAPIVNGEPLFDDFDVTTTVVVQRGKASAA